MKALIIKAKDLSIYYFNRILFAIWMAFATFMAVYNYLNSAYYCLAI